MISTPGCETKPRPDRAPRRRSESPRPVVEGALAVDVRWAARNGLLGRPGPLFGWPSAKRQGGGSFSADVPDVATVRISLRHGQTFERPPVIDEVVRLEFTRLHFGNGRYWFRCPVADCGRRAALLFVDNSRLACRRCAGLAYATQGERARERGLRRAQDIRTRLGGSANILEPFPTKPPSMRWAKYRKLRAAALEAELEFLTVIGEKLGNRTTLPIDRVASSPSARNP